MTRASHSIPHLFDRWERLAERIRDSSRLAIFLDFDGTLSPIVALPGGARLANGARPVLRKLAARRRVTLVVVSGRRRADLRRRIGIRRIRYLGLYGWENGRSSRLPAPALENLVRALAHLLAKLKAFPGVWVEPKQSSFAIHLLGTGAEVQKRVRRLVEATLRPLGESLRVMNNLRDIEVAPASIGDKAVAVRKVLGEPELRGALPIYFGDDWSDEPAFAAARKGISVLVGNRWPTRAQFFLRGPGEVTAALSRVEALVR